MSVSGGQTPKRSGNQRELKELLRSVEKAHKADIQTYSSGHLGPNRLTHKPLDCRPRKPIWNKPKCKDMGPSRVQERSKMEASVEETIDALHSFTIATTQQKPRIQEKPESPSGELLTADLRGALDRTEVAKLRKAKQETCAVSGMVEQDSCLFTHSHEAGLTWRQHFDTQVLRTKDLTTRKCLSGREAAKRHERKLQQALRKLPASGGPCRERLTVFSDVFDDVCHGSPAFGSVLREIKTEYDLYTKSLLSSQSPLQDKSACTPFGVSTEATELKEAAKRVLLLEQEAWRALEENDRVRIEYEDAQAKALPDQKENGGSESRDTGQCDEDVFSGVKQCELSSIAQVEAKRQQVWEVWNEVQRLQKDIRETMVSTVTTSTLENCIRDSEDEIMNFAASNVLLQRTSKDLKQNISVVLSKAKVSEETKKYVREEIWTTLNGHE
ncbi:hypothetical protein PHYPO_G00182830 [Pangasianodon hypophthalmus]|uniref:Translin-associated factor X-interacting protein 1 N-terminal domain-containing protein n=1 Tax=Pangasianodon hypophthalmus TaxID=310915 RepID=A0A5N5PSP7_PANHP|nr:hypothetical protein PHYPO_G00182830 [Pangasianodon hypophthalmus]